MARLAAIVAAAIVLSCATASAQDGGIDPTGDVVLYRFESVPEGAAIQYRGETGGFTNDTFFVEPDYISTIRLILEGYLPCAFSDGTTGMGKMGLSGVGTIFRCRMTVDPARTPDPFGQGPASWVVVDGGPAGPAPG